MWVSFHRTSSDSTKGHERKLFGTPLVMYINEDSLSGVDIDMSISKILAPLRRYTPCKTEKENGFPNSPPGSSSNQSGHSNNGRVYSNEDSGELSFHLSLMEDNRSVNTKPINRESTVKCGFVLKVLLDWTEKEYGLYDSSYLKDLPEVHKTGMNSKKSRQESISLFSCLDAFLKEEPLGPDDMWYAIFD